MGSYFRDFYSPTATQRPTVGDTKFSVVPQDHMGWLKCDGRAVPVSTYNFLFQVIGYSFGGSGSSFNLPDARGRVPGAVGTSTGNTWVLGDLSGEETHQLTIAEMPAHDHGGLTDLSATRITANPHSHTYNAVSDTATVSGGAVGVECYDAVNTGATTGGTTVTLNDPTHQHAIPSQGGDQPHNNIQPTIFMGNMFIFSGKVRPTANNYYPYAAGTVIF